MSRTVFLASSTALLTASSKPFDDSPTSSITSTVDMGAASLLAPDEERDLHVRPVGRDLVVLDDGVEALHVDAADVAHRLLRLVERVLHRVLEPLLRLSHQLDDLHYGHATNLRPDRPRGSRMFAPRRGGR